VTFKIGIFKFFDFKIILVKSKAYIIISVYSLKQFFPYDQRILLHGAEKGRFVGNLDQHQPFSTNGRHELRLKTWACADSARWRHSVLEHGSRFYQPRPLPWIKFGRKRECTEQFYQWRLPVTVESQHQTDLQKINSSPARAEQSVLPGLAIAKHRGVKTA